MTAKSPRVRYTGLPQGPQQPLPEGLWDRQWRIERRPSGVAFVAAEPSDLLPEDPIDEVRHCGCDYCGGRWVAFCDGEPVEHFDTLEKAKGWLNATYFKRQELKLNYISAIQDLCPPTRARQV